MSPTTQAIIADIKAFEERRKEHDRTTPSDRYPSLSIAESSFMAHMARWGSAGYPVSRLNGRWFWTEFCAVRGIPSPFKTKRDAFAAIDRYLDILRDKLAGRI